MSSLESRSKSNTTLELWSKCPYGKQLPGPCLPFKSSLFYLDQDQGLTTKYVFIWWMEVSPQKKIKMEYMFIYILYFYWVFIWHMQKKKNKNWKWASYKSNGFLILTWIKPVKVQTVNMCQAWAITHQTQMNVQNHLNGTRFGSHPGLVPGPTNYNIYSKR